jgi:hypothetical protein
VPLRSTGPFGHTEAVDTLQRFLRQVEDFGGTASSPNTAAVVQSPTLFVEAICRDPKLCRRLLHNGSVSFFFLVSGDIFLHRLVEIMSRFSSKRQVVDIAQQIESDISAYPLTITIMNAAVGIATGLTMWLTGMGDPILWG